MTLVEISIGERQAGGVDWANGAQIVHGKKLHDAFKTEQELALEQEKRVANERYAEERLRQKALRAPIRRRRLKVAVITIMALLSILSAAYIASKPFT